MADDTQAGLWRTQSAVTRPGRSGRAFDGLPPNLPGLRSISQRLVAHYMGSGDGNVPPIRGERLKEVDMRFADEMILRLLELGPPNLTGERPPEKRLAGCCRDFSVLFVAMARHKGIPARIRVGYAGYFKPGWYLDHVIAEVWDAGARRWRLVEPEISDSFADRAGFDPLDVPADQFVTGPRAWRAARAGQMDPERCVVLPDFREPYTRGWLSLRHHLVQDLAALNKAEMLVWDQWGILDEDDPLGRAELLDILAEETSDSGCDAAKLRRWEQKEGLGVSSVVSSYSPAYSSPVRVDVSRVLVGMLKV